MTRRVDAHLERYLGPIEKAWSPAGDPKGVSTCLFRDRPVDGVVTYSTLGLSDHELGMPRARTVRQEIVLAVRETYESDDISRLLFHISDEVIRAHRALLRGDVVPLGAPIVAGARCQHVYASAPIVFAEGFDTFEDTSPATIVIWLFPLTSEEVQFVRKYGWSKFEDRLEQQSPDLFDPAR